MNFIIAAIKSWNLKNFSRLKKTDKKNRWFLIDKKEKLTLQAVKKINPRYIFFPHWSWMIKEEIWRNYDCVVFHMTDLPYGRGGTPLQNLILRGHKKTKISAIKVNEKIDGGDVYLKADLNLSGSAQEIYERASKIILGKMIPYIVKKNPAPQKQIGKVVIFKRRRPEQSRIPKGLAVEKLYDFIRMLDAEEYPKAFSETKRLRWEFSHAKMEGNKLLANVEIYEK